MKNLLIFFCLFFTTIFHLNAQNETCLLIYDIDQNIKKWDEGAYGIKVYTKNSMDSLETINVKIKDFIKDKYLPILGLSANNFDIKQFQKNLDCIVNIETLTWLEFYLSEKILEQAEQLCAAPPDSNFIPTSILKEADKALKEKIMEIMPQSFTHYGFTDITRQPVKYVHISHGNDFLAPYNDDRDMTGSIRIEVGTDFLKIPIFRCERDIWWLPDSRSWYSYQSFFVGGEGYTGYIRDETIYNSPTSYDPDDRPHASFEYIGRAKHRILRTGKSRWFTEFKFGTIGAYRANEIQYSLHQDIVPSVETNGWDAQMSAGGRIGISSEALYERLFGKGEGRKWFNLSWFGEGRVGTEKTFVGAGLNFNSHNLKERGGINIPYLKDKKQNWTSNINYNLRLRYRYIIHNTLLEGYGIFNTWDIDLQDTPLNAPNTLSSNEINRSLFIFDAHLAYRVRKLAIFYSMNITSPEFELPVNTRVYPVNSPRASASHNSSSWHHVGTIGIVLFVE